MNPPVWFTDAISIEQFGNPFNVASIDNFAQNALARDAAKTGKNLHSFFLGGDLAGKAEDLIAEVSALGAVAVNTYINGGDINDIDFTMISDSLVGEGFVLTGEKSPDGSFGIRVKTVGRKLAEQLLEVAKKYITKRTSRGQAFVMISTQAGIKLRSIGASSVQYEPTNYNQKVQDGFSHVIKEMGATDPCGRIVLMDGEPGTGKTHLLRSMMSLVPNAMFVIVQPNMVSQLAQPDVVTSLIDQRANMDCPMVLLIEDADSCLVSRGGDNMSSISSLLNVTDGILGNVLDIRVVATTNADHLGDRGQIDEAILRPGRLCSKISVGKLNREEALVVMERLDGANRASAEEKLGQGKQFSLAEIYRNVRPDGAPVVKNDRRVMGFGG